MTLGQIAACLMNQVNLPGLVQLPKLFKVMRRKKIRQYRDDSRNEEQMNAGEEQPIVPNHSDSDMQISCQKPNRTKSKIKSIFFIPKMSSFRFSINNLCLTYHP